MCSFKPEKMSVKIKVRLKTVYYHDRSEVGITFISDDFGEQRLISTGGRDLEKTPFDGNMPYLRHFLERSIG